MLKKIYQELVLIRKELQARRNDKEFQEATAAHKYKGLENAIDAGVKAAIDLTIRDSGAKAQ